MIRDGILMQKPTGVTPPCVYVPFVPGVWMVWGRDALSLGNHSERIHHSSTTADPISMPYHEAHVELVMPGMQMRMLEPPRRHDAGASAGLVSIRTLEGTMQA